MAALAYTLEYDEHTGRWRAYSIKSVPAFFKPPLPPRKEVKRVTIIAPSLLDALKIVNKEDR